MDNAHGNSSGHRDALRKWGWFIGLWLGGVLTVGAVSLLLRAVLLP